MKFENTQVWGFEHALRGMRNPKNSWHLSDSRDCYEEYQVEGACCFCDDPLYENKINCSGVGKYGNYYAIGPKDMKLALVLINGGPEHRKFLRQIMISVDITAPLYWWKEFDTYKVATVANSTSTMHKIQSYPITRESFEMDDYDADDLKIPVRFSSIASVENCELEYEHRDMIDTTIEYLENMRLEYNAIIEALKLPQGDPAYVKQLQARANKVWKELIRWLPEGWLQTRTVTLNYETIRAMCSPGQRRFHKLNEWSGKNDPTLVNFIAWARTLPYAFEFIFTDEYNAQKEAEKTPFEKAIDALRKIGVSARNADGSLRTVAAVIEDIIKSYQETVETALTLADEEN